MSRHWLWTIFNSYIMLFIVQLDCGIHPGLSGMDALPFVDLIEADQIDLLLISQWVLIFCSKFIIVCN